MIVEHFFNHNLKNAVSELKEEGRFDQQAINKMDIAILALFFILMILNISVAFALRLQYGLVAFTLVAVFGALSAILFCLMVARNFSDNAYLLTCGEFTFTTEVRFHKHRGDAHFHNYWDIEYSYHFRNQKYRSMYRRMPRSLVKRDDSNNDFVKIALDPLNPERSVPVFERTVHRYQLSNPKETG